MPALTQSPRRLPALSAFLALVCLGSASLRADIYDDAVAHAGRGGLSPRSSFQASSLPTPWKRVGGFESD